MRYRKKPVEVDAVRVRDLRADPERPDWIRAAIMSGLIHREPGRTVTVVTLEGTMRAHPDGWIVRGVKGELYPVRGDIFAETYEPVS